MAVSKEMIEQSRENVGHTLVEYFEATEHELACFENKLIIEHGSESWTSGFADELLPMFLEVRNELNNMCKTCEDITLYPDEQCPDCKKIS